MLGGSPIHWSAPSRALHPLHSDLFSILSLAPDVGDYYLCRRQSVRLWVSTRRTCLLHAGKTQNWQSKFIQHVQAGQHGQIHRVGHLVWVPDISHDLCRLILTSKVLIYANYRVWLQSMLTCSLPHACIISWSVVGCGWLREGWPSLVSRHFRGRGAPVYEAYRVSHSKNYTLDSGCRLV